LKPSGSAAGSPGTGTVAGGFCSPDNAIDDTGSTPYPGSHGNGVFRAVLLAGAAFHAKVPVDDHGSFIFDLENSMRANNGTHPASVAFFPVQFQGDYIPEICKSFHNIINLETIHPASPAAAIPI
jgi:hypothetical protein